MSDMTDAETKAYFDGREEGFNDAREQIKELRTRVAELLDNHGVAQKSIEVQADCITHDAEKIRKLQNRLSTLEKSLKDEIAERDRLFDLADKYRCRVLDLLKASEGMEKALELVLKRGTQVQNSDQYMFEVLKQSESALADFRALKEAK